MSSVATTNSKQECTCSEDKAGIGIFGEYLSTHAMNCPLYSNPQPSTQKESWVIKLKKWWDKGYLGAQSVYYEDIEEEFRSLLSEEISSAVNAEKARIINKVQERKQELYIEAEDEGSEFGAWQRISELDKTISIVKE